MGRELRHDGVGAAGALGHRKRRVRRRLELDGDLGVARREPLARAQEERHAGPAPVVDVEREGRVGLHRRARRHARLLAVAGNGLAADLAGAVLPAHGQVRHLRRLEAPHRAQHLDLLVAHRRRAPGGRRLDRHQRHQLHQVVLDHVAKRAGRLVVAAPALHAERLGGRDLDVVNVVVVPDRLEDAVGEAQGEQVLDGLFAQVVVDAVDEVLVDVLGELGVELSGRGEIAPERLLDDHAGPAGVPGLVPPPRQAQLAQPRDDRAEGRRRRREVKQPPAAGPVGVAGRQPLGQAVVAGVVALVGRRHVAQARGELVPGGLVARRRLGQHGLSHARAEGLFGHLGARVADHVKRPRQGPPPPELEERRHHHAVGQIARGAKEHERAGLERRGVRSARLDDHGVIAQLGGHGHRLLRGPCGRRGRRTRCATPRAPCRRRSRPGGSGSA
ncbi:hypothetical protein D3C72_1032670 [compost metagenome]